MKKFQFRLQKLLEIKEHKEKLVENELAKAERKKYKLIEKKDHLLDEYQDSKVKMKKEEQKKILTVDRMLMYQRFFRRLKAGVASQNKLIHLADEEIKLVNDRLIEARKERRGLERLKEKKLKSYNYELEKEEQNFFDEVGNTGYIKERREEQEALMAKVKEKSEIPIKYKEYEKNVTEKMYEEIMKEGEKYHD